MRGGDRKSKSDEELKMSGTFRKDRHSDRLKPDIVSELPPPSHYDDEHTLKWNETVSRLRDTGILTNQDFDTLEAYVSTHVLSQKAWKDILTNGFEIEGYPNPAIKHYLAFEAVLKNIRDQFGFNPRSRQSLKTVKKDEKKADPFTALMSPTAVKSKVG